ncbi:hypothetical protein MAR_034715 [Mya arenaria]|uniref:Uncharacterized protein n=1 Tax=Mya arenaria TaxID=6604 RepID=A0ABY7EKV6_MYAAR|nr:hypothetical protein MAR_034715 [Mya arenaria]
MVKAFWGLCIVMICMTLASISDARYGRRQKSRRARVDPALCTPEVAPYGCLAVPRDCDVIDIQTFRNVINGDVNSILWRIDAVGFLKDGLLPFYVINIGYEITDRNTTRIGFKYRTENVSGPNCMLLQATNDVPEGTLASRDRAIMNFECPGDILP